MIPSKSDKRWREFILSKQRHQLDFLPLKICMSRVQMEIVRDSSERNLQACIDRVYELLSKHERLAASDLKKIFG